MTTILTDADIAFIQSLHGDATYGKWITWKEEALRDLTAQAQGVKADFFAHVRQQRVLNNPRVEGFRAREGHHKSIRVPFSHMHVTAMNSFDPGIPAAQQDQYHMYTHIGLNAANTTYHHKFGDVTVFFSNTSINSDNPDLPAKPDERYLIIVDQWTGERLKVVLPNPVELTDQQKADTTMKQRRDIRRTLIALDKIDDESSTSDLVFSSTWGCTSMDNPHREFCCYDTSEDSRTQGMDECLFCGEPDERK
jgi:hypothetical protein